MEVNILSISILKYLSMNGRQDLFIIFLHTVFLYNAKVRKSKESS
jgi:hypothetical protein